MLVDEYLVLIDKLRARMDELLLNDNNYVRVKILEDEILDLQYAVNLMENPCSINTRPLGRFQ